VVNLLVLVLVHPLEIKKIDLVYEGPHQVYQMKLDITGTSDTPVIAHFGAYKTCPTS